MAAMEQFRVIIVGAGIAGLTLANALEHADINYVLLERRDKVDPQIGQSIGMCGNGSRILDQLGVHDRLEHAMEPMKYFNDRWVDGTRIQPRYDMPLHMHKRSNYPITFLDRSLMLSIIYDQIQDKSKIMLGKALSCVENHDDSVVVRCQDGTTYIGDVLVGCDGVNSKVRSEMWRLADQAKPGTIPVADREAVFADYKCLFGISSRVPGTNLGEMDICFWKKRSFLMVVGKDYRTYFFLTSKYPNRQETGDIPSRYTQEEADAYAEEYLDCQITPELKFRDIWERRELSSLVPTEEAEFKTWHWSRIALAGDGAHKMTPQAGQGGNIAVESAAALANQLYGLKEQILHTGKKPSICDINAALDQYQKKREARVTSMMRNGNQLTRVQSMDTPVHYVIAKYVVPLLGDYLIDLITDGIVGAEILEYLPPPARSFLGTMPFNPEQGTGLAESKVKRALWALPLLFISYIGFKKIDISEFAPTFSAFAKQGRFDSDSVSTHITWIRTGNAGFDSVTGFLTAFFSQVIMGFDHISYWQNLTFLTDFTGFWAILLLESSRRANKLTFMQVPIVFGILAQMLGFGAIGPIYMFFSYVFTPIEKFAASDLRLTDRSYSSGVLPAVLLGYLVPLALSFLHPSLEARSWWTSVWQWFPFWTSLLLQLFKRAGVTPNTVQYDRVYATERDMPILRRTCVIFMLIGSSAYLATLFSSGLSPSQIWMPQTTQSPTLAETVRSALQWDQLCTFASGYFWLGLFFLDLRRAGMLPWSILSLAVFSVFVGVAIGPGSLLIGAWLVREHILSTKRHKAAMTLDNVKAGTAKTGRSK